ncbi:MAG: TIGR01777 family protein [Alphaproteobacteria bacterium]|nr:MAG: TIGR01777 family protein [Alphaproteobacteria bacterium]
MTSPVLWILISVQLALGLFDIVYHHEMMERLAWRVSQRRELKLHAARNLAYAVLFLALGLFELRGFWAMLVIAVLGAEVVITLTDFVEEDMSRKLPASERVTHALLAINYGAVLALLVPVLVGWATQPTAIVPVWYGIVSVLAPLAAAGVIVFGLRDFFAARRAQQLVLGNAGELVRALPGRQRVLITGATGFIGRRLTEALASAGHEVIVLARDPAKAATLRPPFRLITSLNQIADDAAIDTMINFAGEPVANGLWTRTKRRRILASRLRMTRDVVRLIARLQRRPAVMISGSAIGWYGTWADESLTEFDGGKRCFGHRVCEAWECAASKAEKFGVRVVRLRIGIVLGIEAGMLSNLLVPFEFGLGGPIGSGEQWISWIERDDLIRLIAHIIATPQLSGAVNGTAPAPVQNEAFARALGCVLHRPARLRMPASVLHRLAGELADDLLLRGQRVLPDKAQASGFRFKHETLSSALSAMLGQTSAKANSAEFSHALEMQRAR